ncbi:hypothetical protein ACFQZC_04940 [Streptacidiphilus monticola]
MSPGRERADGGRGGRPDGTEGQEVVRAGGPGLRGCPAETGGRPTPAGPGPRAPGPLLPLLREQWLRAVSEDPGLALRSIFVHTAAHPDALTDAFLDEALDTWLATRVQLSGNVLADLDKDLGVTGRGLDARLADRCRSRPAEDLPPDFRLALAEARIEARIADPPMELLVALGPLDEADWWCDVGAMALRQAKFDTAREHFRRAAELGCAQVRPFVVHLELQAAWWDDEDPEVVRHALITARELDPNPDPDLRLYLACRALLAELPTDLGELAALDVDRTDLRDVWLAVAAVRERRHEEARHRLREALAGRAPLRGRSPRTAYGRDLPYEEEVQEFAEELLLLLAREEYGEARELLTAERLEDLLPGLDGLAPVPLRYRALEVEDDDPDDFDDFPGFHGFRDMADDSGDHVEDDAPEDTPRRTGLHWTPRFDGMSAAAQGKAVGGPAEQGRPGGVERR